MPDREDYNEHKSTRLLRSVEGLVVSGNHSTASRLLEDYLTNYPDDPRVLRSLGRLRLTQGRPEEAAELLERAIELMTELRERRSNSSLTNHAVGSPDSPPYKSEDDDFNQDDIDYSSSVASEVEANRKYYSYTERKIPTFEEVSRNGLDELLQTVEGSSGVDAPRRQDTEFCSDDSIPSLSESITAEPFVHHRATVSDNSLLEEEMQTPHVGDTDEVTEIVLPVDETMEDMAGEGSGEGDDEDLDFLLDANTKKPTSTYQDIDFQLLDEHLGELDEEPTPRELATEVSVGGKVTREDRAFQEAIQLGQEFGWDNEGIMILAEVFSAYWWSSAKHAMRRELEAGLHPNELQLAISARRVWAGNEKFGLNISGYPYPGMSWSMALDFIRSFRYYPDEEEIEIILNEIYIEWYARASLQRNYSSFHEYFFNRLQFPCGDFLASPAIFIGDGSEYLGDDFDGGACLGFNTQTHRALEDYGLIPDIWSANAIYRDHSERNIDEREDLE